MRKAARVKPWPENVPPLPVVLLERVLLSCDGDAATLCAAACVSHAWRAAAASPGVWRRLDDLTNHKVSARVTPERLAALVARSGGSASADKADDGLELLNVSGCAQLAPHDVVNALQQRRVTGELRVRGLNVDVDDHFVSLRAVLAPGARLDAIGPCNTLCTRICSEADKHCRHCGVYVCRACAEETDFRTLCEHVCSRCDEMHEDVLRCVSCEAADAWFLCAPAAARFVSNAKGPAVRPAQLQCGSVRAVRNESATTAPRTLSWSGAAMKVSHANAAVTFWKRRKGRTQTKRRNANDEEPSSGMQGKARRLPQPLHVLCAHEVDCRNGCMPQSTGRHSAVPCACCPCCGGGSVCEAQWRHIGCAAGAHVRGPGEVHRATCCVPSRRVLLSPLCMGGRWARPLFPVSLSPQPPLPTPSARPHCGAMRSTRSRHSGQADRSATQV